MFAGRSDGNLVVWRSPNERGNDIRESACAGHTGGIHCMLWAEELGSQGMLLTGSADATVRLWSFGRRDASDPCKQIMRGHGGTVLDVAFSGRYLITASNDRSLRIWAPTPGRQILLFPWFETLQTIRNPDGPETYFSSVDVRVGDTTHIYAGDSGGNLHVLELARRGSSSSPGGGRGGDDTSAGGKVAGSGRQSRSSSSSNGPSGGDGAALFKLNRRWRKGQSPPHSLGITHVKVVPTQNFLITLSYDCTLRVYDAMSCKPFLTEENPHRNRFTGMAWNDAHQELIVVDSGGWMYVWNIYMEKLVKEFQLRHLTKRQQVARSGTFSALSSVTMRPVHQTFIVAGGDLVEQWHISRELSFKEHRGHTGPIVSILTINAHASGVNPVSSCDEEGRGDAPTAGRSDTGKTHDDGVVLYSASLDNTIRSWDPYDMACVSTMEETSSEISCMSNIPLAGLLVTGSDDGAVRFWNPSSGSTIMLRAHENTVSCMCMAHLQRYHYLITAGYDGKVGFWDVTKRARSVKPRIENIFQAHEGRSIDFGGTSHIVDAEILCIVYHEVDPDEQKRVFLTGGNDSVIRVWNVFSYQLEGTLEGHGEAVTCMTLDANFLFSGSDDKTIRVWNLVHPHDAYQLSIIESAHTGTVQDIMILEDTGYLVSCGFDGKIRVWDWGNTREGGHGEGEDAVGFVGGLEDGSEGKEVASGGGGGGSPAVEAKDDDGADDAAKQIVREFSHDSQFRCLAYYAGTKEILAGTEEARILSFSLEKKKVSVGEEEEEEEEEEGEVINGGDEGRRAPRSGQLEEN
jgi:WD40 repeat protein